MITGNQTPELYRLVYYSKNRISGSNGIEAEVESILAASRKNNAAQSITGALIFNSGIFAQVLEGDLRSIETTFERIQRDQRHGDVQVLAFEQTSARSFPSWSMGYVGKSLAGHNVFGHIGLETGFEGKRFEGERVLQIMRTIALEEEAQAA